MRRVSSPGCDLSFVRPQNALLPWACLAPARPRPCPPAKHPEDAPVRTPPLPRPRTCGPAPGHEPSGPRTCPAFPPAPRAQPPKLQPRSSSVARVSKGVRLRHHSQMAEPPWPAAQAAHWTLPPAAATTIGWYQEPRHSIGSCCRRSTPEPQVPPPR